MRIIEAPQYGPMFRFSDANVYWALHLLSDGKRIGRRRLAEAIGVGEGSMRRILETLREWEMVSVRQTGIVITRSGLGFLSELPLKVLDLDLSGSVVGEHSQAVMVLGAADKIENGMQQRDAGIKVGASGCTTVIYRDGALMIPPDWNLDEEDPRLAKAIRALGMTERDVIIAGGGPTRASAVSAALTAAFELFRNLFCEPPFRPAGAGRNGRNVYAFLSGWRPSLREASEMAHDAMRLLLSAALLAALAGFFAAAPALVGGAGGDGLPEECPGSDLTGTEGGAFNALGADAGGTLEVGALFDEGELKYEVLEDMTVSCIGPVDSGIVKVVIPSKVVHSGTEYSVQTIGDSAFYDCDALRTVTIGDGVQTIGDSAFYDCDALRTVTIPDSVQTIGDSAFHSCALQSVTIPDSVQTIGDSAFRTCDALGSVSIPGSVQTIGDSAFLGCGALQSVTIGDGVQTIGGGAFWNCGALQSVTIPGSVETIGECAFMTCDALETVTIPGSVQTIGEDAFANCVALKTVTIGDGVLTIGNWAFDNCVALESVDIPDSVETIGEGAFYDCDALESVDIPDSVQTIGDSAFNGCDALQSVSIGDGVQTIGSWAFANCHAFGSINLNPDNASYCLKDGVLFSKDMSVLVCYPAGKADAQYVIPDGVQIIWGGAFSHCSALQSVTIPDGVETIGSSAFERCGALQSVSIPGSVQTIGSWAFADCWALRTVTIPGSVRTIGYNTFCNCTLKTVVIGDGIQMIGEDAFSSCGALQSVSIPGSVQTIERLAFRDCRALQSIDVNPANASYRSVDGVLFSKDMSVLVCYPAGKADLQYVIPDGVQTIGGGAFWNCDTLESVSIPGSVRTIEMEAFSGCAALESVSIPDGVRTIEGFAFSGCRALGSVTIPGSVQTIGGGVFINCDALQSVTIGDGVQTIGREAFHGCGALQSVTIPGTVQTIGEGAFCGCGALGSVTIPGSVQTIGEYAFDDCDALESVTIGDGVQTIGNHAFCGCGALGSVTIPDSVRTIGQWAFANCHALRSINLNPDNASYCLKDGVLFSEDMSVLVCYPAGKADLQYAIPDGVQTIGGGAFEDCGALESVTISDGVQTIGDYAFYGCTALKDMIFEGSSSPELGDHCLSLGYELFSTIHPATCTVHSFFYSEANPIPENAAIDSRGNRYTTFIYDYTAPPVIDLGSDGVSVVISGRYVYTGDVQHVSYAVSANGAQVPAGELEIAFGGSGTGAGTYRLVVKAQESSAACVGRTAPVEWTIEPRPLADSMIGVSGKCMYNGTEQAVSFEVRDGDVPLREGADYAVASGDAGIAAGQRRLVICGMGNYAGEASFGWEIAPKPLADSMVHVSGGYVCDGTEQSVSFEVRDGGAALVEGRDYEVASGASGVGAGRYTLTVEGAGNYCGRVSAGWSIARPVRAVSDGIEYFGCGDGTFRCEGADGPVKDVKVPQAVAGPDGTERTVASIAPGAFAGNAAIETAELPETLAEVPAGAFAGCTGLREVRIGDGVSAIGESAFEGCASLEEVRIPSSVRSVSASAFSGCPSLRSVVLSGGFAEAAMSVLAREWRLPGQEARTVERIAVEGAVDLSDVAALDGRELVILSDGTSGGVFYGDDGETLLEGAGRALGGSRPFVPYPDAPEPNAWRAVSVGSEDGSSDVIAAAAAAALLAVAAAVLWIRRR